MTDLKPCPFCGERLEEVRRKYNPFARCNTSDCMGGKLPLISLDVPADIERWNRRVPPGAAEHSPVPATATRREAIHPTTVNRINALLNTSVQDAAGSLTLMLTQAGPARTLEICTAALVRLNHYGADCTSHRKAFSTAARKALKVLEKGAQQ